MKTPIAAFITPQSADFLKAGIEPEYIKSAEMKMLAIALKRGYRTFLCDSIGAGDWIAYSIISNPKLTFIWCIAYGYQRDFWQFNEDIGALELIQNADQVIDLEFTPFNDFDDIYHWLIERADFIIAITLKGDKFVTGALDSARQKGCDGVVFSPETGKFSPIQNYQCKIQKR